jgi:hypothetical protein
MQCEGFYHLGLSQLLDNLSNLLEKVINFFAFNQTWCYFKVAKILAIIGIPSMASQCFRRYDKNATQDIFDDKKWKGMVGDMRWAPPFTPPSSF